MRRWMQYDSVVDPYGPGLVGQCVMHEGENLEEKNILIN
jgi:hypothetical protein